MTVQIKITNGVYRGQEVNGLYELVKEWTSGANGGFVTVLNDGSLDGAGEKARVKVAQGDFEMFGEFAGTYHSPKGKDKIEEQFEETDEEIIGRFEKTFSFVETMTAAAQDGKILGLVISGPAGIGKSYGVEKTLEKMNFQRTLKGQAEKYELVTGGTSAPGLYMKLWENREAGRVLVFDDCDSAFWDELQLNMLKAAMDTKPKRRICWMKDKEFKDADGEKIPSSFVFEGSVVFLTNTKFDNCRSQKIAQHLEAIMSRVHYMDLRIDTLREKLLRVKHVVGAGMLDKHNLSDQQKQDVIEYVYDNVEYLHELSLRTVLKVADLAMIARNKDAWNEIADETLLSKNGLIRKMIAKRAEA